MTVNQVFYNTGSCTYACELYVNPCNNPNQNELDLIKPNVKQPNRNSPRNKLFSDGKINDEYLYVDP